MPAWVDIGLYHLDRHTQQYVGRGRECTYIVHPSHCTWPLQIVLLGRHAHNDESQPIRAYSSGLRSAPLPEAPYHSGLLSRWLAGMHVAGSPPAAGIDTDAVKLSRLVRTSIIHSYNPTIWYDEARLSNVAGIRAGSLVIPLMFGSATVTENTL